VDRGSGLRSGFLARLTPRFPAARLSDMPMRRRVGRFRRGNCPESAVAFADKLAYLCHIRPLFDMDRQT
jgi:hypothetical protein